MLLEFKFENYKSFADECVFSMIPAQKQKGLDYSIIEKIIDRKKYKALSSAVIYGPNAAGKTNIIGAMETFKNIILRGNIRNDEKNESPNLASYTLEMIPCCFNKRVKPVSFSIRFIDHNLCFDYSLKLDIGKFFSKKRNRRILEETLLVNENLIFSRTNTLIIDNLDKIKKYLVENYISDANIKMLAESNLNPEELFLVNGFKNIYSNKLYSIINNWIKDKFIVIYGAVDMYTIPVAAKNEKKYTDQFINNIARTFGINSNKISYIKENNRITPYSIVDVSGKFEACIPLQIFESYGTYRFINEFPWVLEALQTGGTLVVDEFDASIHPMVMMNIINIFHNDEININKAQLIFNTHNPIFLDGKLFRRDEIKFVERNDETRKSIHYALSDFKTGTDGVRKSEDYMKNYFVSKYGAIKSIDFTSLIESLIKPIKDVEDD